MLLANFTHNPVRESVRWVVEHAQHVRIDDQRLASLAAELKPAPMDCWWKHAPYSLTPAALEERLNQLALFSLLCFSYWHEQKWQLEYNGQKVDGSYALLAALERAQAEGLPVWSLRWWRGAPFHAFERVVRGQGTLPFVAERWKFAQQLGRIITERYQESLLHWLSVGGFDPARLLRMAIEELPCADDKVVYEGKEVVFFKRAQLLVMDLLLVVDQAGRAPKPIRFDFFTAGSDYKLPQLLRHRGVLEYSEPLAAKIDAMEEVVSGSAEEVEIRALTVHAVELIAAATAQRGSKMTPCEISNAIWLESQDSSEFKPYHRTRTIHY